MDVNKTRIMEKVRYGGAKALHPGKIIIANYISLFMLLVVLPPLVNVYNLYMMMSYLGTVNINWQREYCMLCNVFLSIVILYCVMFCHRNHCMVEISFHCLQTSEHKL